MLRSIHPGAEAQAYVVGKLVPSNLCEVIKEDSIRYQKERKKEDSSRSWLSLYVTFSKIKRRFCKLSAHPKSHCSEIDHTGLSTDFSESGHVNWQSMFQKFWDQQLISTSCCHQALQPYVYPQWRYVYSPLNISNYFQQFSCSLGDLPSPFSFLVASSMLCVLYPCLLAGRDQIASAPWCGVGLVLFPLCFQNESILDEFLVIKGISPLNTSSLQICSFSSGSGHDEPKLSSVWFSLLNFNYSWVTNGTKLSCKCSCLHVGVLVVVFQVQPPWGPFV